MLLLEVTSVFAVHRARLRRELLFILCKLSMYYYGEQSTNQKHLKVFTQGKGNSYKNKTLL